MSEPKEPLPAKVVTAILFNPLLSQRQFFEVLEDEFGEIDFVSENLRFKYSKYYEPEMGENLIKRFVAYKALKKQDELVTLKLLSIEIEKRFGVNKKRRLNIDPGLLTLERFVLATGKNYSHRIYLQKGIFADLTLIFKKGSYTPLPWTYPDYKEPLVIGWLNKIRQKYNYQLKMLF